MGSFSMRCSISNLGISAGDSVRALLLTQSPYDDDSQHRGEWLVRTPPIRAEYNDYGSIENINPKDEFICDLWLRGLREDLVEKGLGDNSCHDVPARKDMTFDQLLDAVQEGRVEVVQDSKNFWMRPRNREDLYDAKTTERICKTPSMERVEKCLAEDEVLLTHFGDSVARSASEDKFVVDEPVPHLVRVRFGQYEHGERHMAALRLAKEAVERAGFAGVVVAGSGRYASDADLLVFPAAGAAEHISGPQWDMARGQAADDKKHLRVVLALVREDVWQALANYPHADTIYNNCVNCGISGLYHERGNKCPSKDPDPKEKRFGTFKEHDKRSTYTYGQVVPKGVQHVIEVGSGEYPRDTLWTTLDSFKVGTRGTWKAILDHFNGKTERKRRAKAADAKVTGEPIKDDVVEKMLRALEENCKVERARIAALPREEQRAIRADARKRATEYRAQERERKARPHFGDFQISNHIIAYEQWQKPGAWILRESTPGVIGINDHLSMCLADKRRVPGSLLDAIAELSAVRSAIAAVRLRIEPTTSHGPQYPEWDHHVRFARTCLQIAEQQVAERNAERGEEDRVRDLPATFREAQEMVKRLSNA